MQDKKCVTNCSNGKYLKITKSNRKSEWKRIIVRFNFRWEDNSNTESKEIIYHCVWPELSMFEMNFSDNSCYYRN